MIATLTLDIDPPYGNSISFAAKVKIDNHPLLAIICQAMGGSSVELTCGFPGTSEHRGWIADIPRPGAHSGRA
jgi:hypothetical protein